MHACIWVRQWAAGQSRRRLAKSRGEISGFGGRRLRLRLRRVLLRVGFEKPDIEQGFRRIVRNLEKNPAASDLKLMCHAIRKFEIRVVGQKFPLNVGNLRHVPGNPFQVHCVGTERAPLTFISCIFQNVFRYSMSARLSVSGKSVPK
jgi:hypothetical protein